MKVAILIPARFASSRFPGKPLVDLRGAGGTAKPLIQRSFEAGQRVGCASSVHILTDDDRIASTAAAFGASVIMTSPECRNGTERCAEALPHLGDVDLVVNLQGDALLTPAHFIDDVVNGLGADPGAQVATPAIRLRPEEVRALQAEEAAGRVGGTTVVTDDAGRALYFSKRLIPYVPEATLGDKLSPVRLHVGVYAYRPSALRAYAGTPPSELEEFEGLEQLRFLAAGVPVKVVEVEAPSFSLRELNNPEDIGPIEQALAEAGLE